MAEYHATLTNAPHIFMRIQAELDDAKALLIVTTDGHTGKWGMAKLWRVWMSATAQYMAAKGCSMPLMISADGEMYGARPFDENDAHELFTAKWLGVDKDGLRLSWSRSGRDGMRPATKGERFLAMQRHEAWAAEKGIMLTKPRGSEYYELEAGSTA